MSDKKAAKPQGSRIDYSEVTPATGTDPDGKKIAATLANQMPTADMPAFDGSGRSDPDKTIPGPEAASGVDAVEEERTQKYTKERKSKRS